MQAAASAEDGPDAVQPARRSPGTTAGAPRQGKFGTGSACAQAPARRCPRRLARGKHRDRPRRRLETSCCFEASRGLTVTFDSCSSVPARRQEASPTLLALSQAPALVLLLSRRACVLTVREG